MGKTALEGLKGVTTVERAWMNFKEIDTLDYSPGLISMEEMEAVLEKTVTYRGTGK